MAELLQIGKGTSVTITETFEIDGSPINTDGALPTLTILRPDGTAYTPLPTVLDTWAGPPARTTGQYRFVLPRQLECTWLDYELTGTIGGLPQTLEGRVEWLGVPLFRFSAFRAMRVAGGTPFASTATPKYEDAQIMDTRTAVLDEFAQILGFSPVPRFARETLDGDGRGQVLLDNLKAHTLLSVTVGGAVQTVGSYTLKSYGALQASANYLPSGTFTAGLGNVVVEYVHGAERVPGNGSHVAMMYAAAQLNPSGFSSASTVSMPDGSTYTYEPSETGRSGFQRHTGIREVDRWLNRWAQSSVAVA